LSYHDVSAIVEQNVNFTHSNYRDELNADARALVDPADSFVIGEAYRLEELIVLFNPYGGVEEQQWFKVNAVTVGQYHQTTGEVNTVNLTLQKTRALEYVS
jgi:hypothetical protein